MAFLYNRKIQGDDDVKNFQEHMRDCNYTQSGPCEQLYIMERDFDETDALKADNSVGSIAANVEVNSKSVSGIFPKRIAKSNAILTFVYEARLPTLEGNKHNVLSIEWEDARQKVLESLLKCATLQSLESRSRTAKKHAGSAQNILTREISALASSVSTLGHMGAASSSLAVQQPRDFFSEPPLQPVAAFLEHCNLESEWADVAQWLVEDFLESKLLLGLNPGWSEVSAQLTP